MTAHEQLVAYLATLFTLALVFAIAIIAAAMVPELLGKAEVFGLGTITGGLIGILRIPTSRAPAASTDSGDINVTTPKE